MASPWAHAIAGAAVGSFFQGEKRRRVITLAAICAAAPDLDLIGWPLGISPESLLGHRGLTHSIPFAILLSGLATTIFLPSLVRRERVAAACLLMLATATHGLLDAMTSYAPRVPRSGRRSRINGIDSRGRP